MRRRLPFAIAFLFFSQLTLSKDFTPAPLIQLDSLYSHHVLIAEKATHRLHLFQQNPQRGPVLIKTYQMATGKKAGDKTFQGDFRTPEGIYEFATFLTHQDLIKRHGKTGEIYGVGAFVMNYPNPIDQMEGKTGGGIWLHSTNDESRLDKGLDSRGCIVTSNKDLIEIGKFLELQKTPIIVTHRLNYLDSVSMEIKKKEVLEFLESWRHSWEEENHQEYIDHYANDFTDPVRGNLTAFKNYKKRVFSGPGQPKIELDKISVLASDSYILAVFHQHYESHSIQDVGKKVLYLKKDPFYRWKIVSEKWSKIDAPQISEENKGPSLAFRPSQRFFTSSDPRTILGKDFDLKLKKN